MPEGFTQRLEEGIYEIVSIVPQIAAALGILLAGYVIARMIEHGTDALLHRIGLDRWMQEGGVTEALQRAGTTLDASSVLAKLAFWIVMLLVILVASSALGLTIVGALFAEILAYIPNVLAAVIVLVLGIILGEFVKDLVLASAGAIRGGRALARAAKVAVIVLTAFMALEQLDIAEDILLVLFVAVVGAGALGAAIAFGLGAREIAGEIARDIYERSRAEPPTRPAASGGGEPRKRAVDGGEPERTADAE